jgi:hypothetical protein
MHIYYDSLPEGLWFQSLHRALAGAKLDAFPTAKKAPSELLRALSFDRPDIILTDDHNNPILILERTVEVPSGHNVGQRFARLVGAAKMRVPSVYFGPFKAYKHGGQTQGPRYMNLRLFYAIERMAEVEETVSTIINWPVDEGCEIVRTNDKDVHVGEYLEHFFNYYLNHGMVGIIKHLRESNFEAERRRERAAFATADVQNPSQYDSPPPSVSIGPISSLRPLSRANTRSLAYAETVLYKIGMSNVRSDPYTGTSLLYSYLYCGGHPSKTRNMVLYFPNISIAMWRAIGRAGGRKDERLFRLVADGILFSDGYLPKPDL